MNLSKSVRFAFNAMNAVKKTFKRWKISFQRLSGEKNFFTATSRMRWKKNFSPLPAECGEKKFFTATSRMRWKKNFSPLPAECGEKKFFTAKIANLTNIQRANFNTYLIFTGNIIAVSDRWRSGLRSWWHAWGRGSNPSAIVSFLEEFRWMRWKKIFHRKIQRNSCKNSPLSAHSTLKDAGALRWKKFFFHRYSSLILHYFLTKPRPGNIHWA